MLSLKPFEYAWVLDNNKNTVSTVCGPCIKALATHESVLRAPLNMVVVPPGMVAKIKLLDRGDEVRACCCRCFRADIGAKMCRSTAHTSRRLRFFPLRSLWAMWKRCVLCRKTRRYAFGLCVPTTNARQALSTCCQAPSRTSLAWRRKLCRRFVACFCCMCRSLLTDASS